ncbi:hypothetical protein ACWF5H_18220, partial [Arthrobacter sp. NPDC055138]
MFSESLLLKQGKQRPIPFKIRQDLVRFSRLLEWFGGRDSQAESAGNGDLQRLREPGKLEKLLRSDG